MNQEDTLILDVRSNYEHHLGKFKNAITLDIDNFYDLPEALKTHPLYLDPQNKSKKILTYCTGGVKCETASSYLQKLGFQHVYQLKGGIINYGHQMKGVDFQGSCYVFDGRITAHVNEVNPVVISKCWFCNHDCDVAVNCRNSSCDRRMTSCQHCFQIHQGCLGQLASLIFQHTGHFVPFAFVVCTLISKFSLKEISAFDVMQSSEKSIFFVISSNF